MTSMLAFWHGAWGKGPRRIEEFDPSDPSHWMALKEGILAMRDGESVLLVVPREGSE